MVGVIQFVVELDTNDRPAVLIEQTLHLIEVLLVKSPDILQINRIVGPRFDALLPDPVGDTSVADLAVTKRADTQQNVKMVLFADFDKTSQISSAGKVELPFNLFVVNPEAIGGYHIQPSGFHFFNGIVPQRIGITGIMDFAHDRKPGFTVLYQKIVVHGDGHTVGIGGCAHDEVVCYDLFLRGTGIYFIQFRGCKGSYPAKKNKKQQQKFPSIHCRKNN